MAAIEARDVVQVRLLDGRWFRDMDGVLYREGQTMTLPRRAADDLASGGVVEIVT